MTNPNTISGRLSESVRIAQGILTEFSVHESAQVQAYCEERGYATESVSDGEDMYEDSDRSLRDAHYKWWKRYGDHSPRHAERSKEDLKKNNDKRQNLYRDVVKTNIEKNRSRNQQAHYDKVIGDQQGFKKFSPELQKTIQSERDAEQSKKYKADRHLKQTARNLDSVDFSDDTANRLVLAPYRKHTKHWEEVDEASRTSRHLGLDKAGKEAAHYISAAKIDGRREDNPFFISQSLRRHGFKDRPNSYHGSPDELARDAKKNLKASVWDKDPLAERAKAQSKKVYKRAAAEEE